MSGRVTSSIRDGLGSYLPDWVQAGLVEAGLDHGVDMAAPVLGHWERHHHLVPELHTVMLGRLLLAATLPGADLQQPTILLHASRTADRRVRTWAEHARHARRAYDLILTRTNAALLWARDLREADETADDVTRSGADRAAAAQLRDRLCGSGSRSYPPLFASYLPAARALTTDVPDSAGMDAVRAALLERLDARCAERHADITDAADDPQGVWDVPVHTVQAGVLRSIALIRREGRLHMRRATTPAAVRTAYGAATTRLAGVTVHGIPGWHTTAGVRLPDQSRHRTTWTYSATAKTQVVAQLIAANPSSVQTLEFEEQTGLVGPSAEVEAATAGFVTAMRVKPNDTLAGGAEVTITYAGTAAPPAGWSVTLVARTIFGPARLVVEAAPAPAE